MQASSSTVVVGQRDVSTVVVELQRDVRAARASAQNDNLLAKESLRGSIRVRVRDSTRILRGTLRTPFVRDYNGTRVIRKEERNVNRSSSVQRVQTRSLASQ